MASRTFVVCCTLALLVGGISARASLGLLGGVVGGVGQLAGGLLGDVVEVAVSVLELPKILVLSGYDFYHGICRVIPGLKTPLYEVIYAQGPLTVEFVNFRLNQCVTILQQLVAQKQISHEQAEQILVRIQEQLGPVLAGKIDTKQLVPVHL